MNCRCHDILNATFPRHTPLTREKILIHLMGCPEDSETKEYGAKPWYKKLFSFNPNRWYWYQMKSSGLLDA